MSRQGVQEVSQQEGGFALALVILLLFAIGIAGATAYEIVRGEATLALQDSESQNAFVIARSGLERFLGEEIGAFPDTVTYALSGGDAVVIARKVSDLNEFESMYLVSSEGIYSAPQSGSSPARRVIHQYAIHRETPLNYIAAYTHASGDLDVENEADIRGVDISTTADCPQGGGPSLVGVAIGSGDLDFDSNDLNGWKDTANIGSYAAVRDTLDIAWDILTDPAFSVDFEDTWASSLPADSFPVVRFNSSVDGFLWTSGRGVLIVDGTFTPRWDFGWDGVILARVFNTRTTGGGGAERFRIRGLVVGGFENDNQNIDFTKHGRIDYHRCNVLAAARSLSHFRPIGRSWWEEL